MPILSVFREERKAQWWSVGSSETLCCVPEQDLGPLLSTGSTNEDRKSSRHDCTKGLTGT